MARKRYKPEEIVAKKILPVLWEDNYVSLLPGDERIIAARFPGRHSIGSRPTLKISGWNIEAENRVIGRGSVVWRGVTRRKPRASAP